MEREEKNQEKNENENNEPVGGAGAAGGSKSRKKRLRLKQLKQSANMIFIKKFDIQQCQGESQLFNILSTINGFNINTFIAAVDHTRLTRDHRMFIIVFKSDAQVNKIKEWAQIIDGARVNALGPDYKAFKYAKEHGKQMENAFLADAKCVVVKGLTNESPSSLAAALHSQGNVKVISVFKWSQFGWFTVELASHEDAQKVVSQGTAPFGTQQARFEFEKPRKPRRGGPPIQCKKCQIYGHTAKFCVNSPRCKYCGKTHNSRDCNIKDNNKKWRCCNCKRKHIATSKNCPKYQSICEKIGYKYQSPRELAKLRKSNNQRGGAPIRRRKREEPKGQQQPRNASFASIAGNGQSNLHGDIDINTGPPQQSGSNENSRNFNENANFSFGDEPDDDYDDQFTNGSAQKKRRLNGGQKETQASVIARLRDDIEKEKREKQALAEEVKQLHKQLAALTAQLKQLSKQQKQQQRAAPQPPPPPPSSSDDDDTDIEIDAATPTAKGKGKGKSKGQPKSKGKSKSKSKAKAKAKGQKPPPPTTSASRGQKSPNTGTRRTRRSSQVTMETHDKRRNNGSTSSNKSGTNKGNNK